MGLIQAFKVRVAENVTAGATATNSANLGAPGDFVVRLVCNDQPFRYAIGPGATATAASALVPPGLTEYHLVSAGDRVSLIREGGTAGTVSVAFMTR